MNDYLIGIDIGTTGVKSMLFSSAGTCLGRSYQAYPTSCLSSCATEQSPADWWNAVVQTIRSACADQKTASRVAALSFATQGGTLIAVDGNMKVLSPAFVWNDCRCRAQRAQYENAFGKDRMYKMSGWHISDGLPAFQIKRLRDEQPELFCKTAFFLSVSDYLIMRLTGEVLIDFSNAGINQLINIRQGCYDSAMLAWLGISEKQLPVLVSSGQAVGRLKKEVAHELGLPEGVCVVSGAHDQYAAILGAGIISGGTVLVGAGSAWAACLLSHEARFETGFAQSRSALDPLWGSLVSLSNGGVCLAWLREKILGGISFEEIDRIAALCPIGSDGLCFYPQTVSASALTISFAGMHLGHERCNMARAVMEGVSFQLSRTLDLFASWMDIDGIVFSGGAAKSRFWTQLTCNILGRSLSVSSTPDLPALGAAVLAGVGCGMFSCAEDGISKIQPQYVTYVPEEDKEPYVRLLRQYERGAYG